MKRVQGKSGNFGSWLTVQVEKKPDGSFYRFTPLDKEGKKNDDPFVVRGNNVPNNMPVGTLVVKVNADKDTVESFIPYEGMFEMKFDKFSAPEGEEPKIKTESVKYTSKSGKPIDYERNVFTALLKITEGEYKDCIITYKLSDKFVSDDEGNLAVASGKAGDRLFEFLQATGVANAKIKYADNPLPSLEKYMNRADKTFRVVMKGGWVHTLFKD